MRNRTHVFALCCDARMETICADLFSATSTERQCVDLVSGLVSSRVKIFHRAFTQNSLDTNLLRMRELACVGAWSQLMEVPCQAMTSAISMTTDRLPVHSRQCAQAKRTPRFSPTR